MWYKILPAKKKLYSSLLIWSNFIHILTKQGMYGQIKPSHDGAPDGKACWNSWGRRLYLSEYPKLSHKTESVELLAIIMLTYAFSGFIEPWESEYT